MAVKRFLLDTSELNDATYGLDGGLAFILDTSTLDSTRVLDGAEFLTTATGTASLGAMSASATATVAHFATASALFGELVAEVAQVIVTTEATAEAQLGGLSSTATATVVLPATASADLGGLASSATATVALPATASADLGGLAASAITAVEQNAIATASLGGLVATVNSIPTPPAPEPTPAPSGRRRVYSTTPRKKIEPVIEPVVEIPVIEPKRRYAVASTSLTGMQAQATSTITFSILEDEAELLLMI
ncbi:MAG: hypothetical protein ACO3ON_00860 [Ilumatobacteraceae bacterium]